MGLRSATIKTAPPSTRAHTLAGHRRGLPAAGFPFEEDNDIIRKAIVFVLTMWVLISGGGGPVAEPFDSSVDCETYRVQQGTFQYHCVPLLE